ncbi:MAG: DUF3795 domain-containing protein [Ignavibacteriae bacterium]|nr:MAG: DUF3795 domain-containing protein [Ignavibacteriota bacterium]
MLSACGLDCSKCDIFIASSNIEVAKKIAEWFNEFRHANIDYKDIHCGGCKCNVNDHWSPDCWILNCCVSKKHIDDCSECDTFPCIKLKEWSYMNDGYLKAYNTLEKLRNERLNNK